MAERLTPGAATPAGGASRAPASEPPISAEVARTAVQWLVELQAGDVPLAAQDAWRRWRAAHPDHERAWQRIESVNGRMRRLATPMNAAIAQATLAPVAAPRRRRSVKGLTVLLLAGGAAWAVRDGGRGYGWVAWSADERTAVGERRRIALDDGTAVALNSDSAIRVAYRPGERRLHLLAGEILVRTARDPGGSPFLVETAEGEVQALGTHYGVRQQAGVTRVAVFEGSVRLVPRDPGAQPRVLQAGEQALLSVGEVSAVRRVDADRMAWADGFIIARGMPLAEFLAELGRHSTRPLSCDPAVASLRVSGSYPLADVDKVLQALSVVLSLDIETVPRLWGLLEGQVRLVPRRG